MMKVARSLVYTFVAIALAACGSSGSNNGPDVTNNNSGNANNTSNNANTNNSGNTNKNTNNSANTNNNTNNPIYTNMGSNTGITKAVARDQTLYSLTHSWKVAPPTGKLATEAQKVVTNTNKLRAEVGLPALKHDERLSAYAQRRAEEIVRSFEHARLNGQNIQVGGTTNYVGENIAAGNTTADKTVLDQWRNSSGHYKNMILKTYTKMGAGVVYVPGSKYGYYWVQIFADDATTSKYYFDSNIAETNNKAPLTSLLVDGVSIPLNIQSGQWQNFSGNNHSGTVSGYTYTRFGVVKNNDVNRYQTFYQGTPTANMPQTGSATYVGQAVVVSGQKTNTQAAAQFNANFQSKSLTGTIRSSGQTIINLKAGITGNTFHSDAGADVETHGGFFGNNAAELAGDFREQKANGKIGAFGAKKQP
ncbi:CAP domain-containing protein [Kingella negevensis]|uniref:Cysteine-rich secretory protein family protein n=1 Tax=Kingella negevensis TaxID=1522312 RepID=A0A238HF37_9NEIS|nr:transferrin-binding protein-like solute binding protein [Kingella negevensis]MDK4697344.1 CAP domain-containing protein [Kingella negevensis]WII93484.1 CAP domain-containing protein [Kingella negevensis]SNB61956.1 Cysteine-rich secretory protein family protein [Kingella negevensis]